MAWLLSCSLYSCTCHCHSFTCIGRRIDGGLSHLQSLADEDDPQAGKSSGSGGGGGGGGGSPRRTRGLMADRLFGGSVILSYIHLNSSNKAKYKDLRVAPWGACCSRFVVRVHVLLVVFYGHVALGCIVELAVSTV